MKVLRYKNQVVSLENVLEVECMKSLKRYDVAISYTENDNRVDIDVATEQEDMQLLEQIYSILSAD